MKKSANLWKSIRLGLAVLAGLVIYAYGFQVTKVDLTEFRKESRQESRLRTLRQFARPDILEYDQEVFVTYTPILVPCPAGGYTPPEPDKNGPYLVFTPACGNPGETILVEGFNLQPGTEGPVSFVPSSDPNNTLALLSERARADEDGHFSIEFKLPERPSESEQYIAPRCAATLAGRTCHSRLSKPGTRSSKRSSWRCWRPPLAPCFRCRSASSPPAT
jgi:hypothetical protein